MIKNKLIKIKKDNQFDKGWSLFSPFDFGISNDRNFKDIAVSDVIKLITFSNSIKLILKEPCLSSRIIEEIKWANKYIKVDLIAKEKKIIEFYSMISFSSVKVDETIDFNYIGIAGKENKNFFIVDGFSETDDTINRTYFVNKSSDKDFSFLDNTLKAIIIDASFNQDHSELIAELKKRKISQFYLGNVENFTKNHLQKLDEINVECCISESTRDGVLLQKDDGRLMVLSLMPNGCYSTYYIENANSLYGHVYKSLHLPDEVKTNALKDNVYSCINGNLRKLKIEKLKTIELDRYIETMEDFINEKFDSSIVSKHNDYSAEAESVEYLFTLIPPAIDDSFKESSIYDKVHDLNKQFNELKDLDNEKIEKEYHCFLDEDFGLIDFLNKSSEFVDAFNGSVKKCNYKGYLNVMRNTLNLFEGMNSSLVEVFTKMFDAINEKSSVNKFDKFDNEIAGYQQTIKEKTQLIEKGVDILSNKRRIEILTNKINDLLKLKEKFEGTSSSRNDKASADFAKFCNDLLKGVNSKAMIDDSIGNVIKPKEETKVAKLELFVNRYLLKIKQFIEERVVILRDLVNVDIPEDYQVFEKNKAKYIVINDLDEFESTAQIREKFNLNCLVRR